MRPKSKLFATCIALCQLYGVVYGAPPNFTWISTSNPDLLTAGNWEGGAVPTVTAFFDSTVVPTVVGSTTDTTMQFQIGEFHFVNSASYFDFTFTGPGALNFNGVGITGTNTNTLIKANNSGNLNVPEILYSAGTPSSMGSATFQLNNSGILNSILLVNMGQLVLADSDDFSVSRVSALNNASISVNNSGSVGGQNEAAQIFSKGASFSAQNFFTLTATNSGSVISPSDTGQIVLDGLVAPTNFSTGDNAQITLTNQGGISSIILGGKKGNNAAQVVVDGRMGASLQVGNSAILDFENSGSISTVTSGNDVGQLLLDGNKGTATFQAGNNASLTFNNLASGNLMGLGFDTAQIVVDGDGDIAGFTVGTNALMTVNNAGTIFSGSNANSAAQLLVDANGATASVSLGENSQVEFTNSGTLSNNVTGSLAAQVVFEGSSLNTGSNVALTATNSGSITNFDPTIAPAQFYFSDATLLGTPPTLTAINHGSSSVEGIIFNGASNANKANIVLQNSSLVNYGTINIGSLTGDSTSVVKLHGDLTISPPTGTTSTFAGVIFDASGTNSITINGPGTGVEIFSGANTYGGGTFVEGATLVLNSSVLNNVTVDGGLFAGSGTVGGNLIVNASGRVQGGPPGGIGTLHVNGDYTNNGGTLDANFNSIGQSSVIQVGGSATITGGDVVATALSLPPAPIPYLLVHANDGVTGTYDGVTLTTPVGLTATLRYDSNNVYLFFPGAHFPANTCSQKGVAGVFENLFPPTPDQLLILQALAALSEKDLLNTFSQISGEPYNTLFPAAEIIGQQFLRRLYDPIRTLVTIDPCNIDPCAPTVFDAWFEAGGGQFFLNRTGNSRGLSADMYQLTGGLQGIFADAWTLGAAVSYAQTYNRFKIGGHNHHNTTFGAIYGLYRPCSFYILADAAFGYGQGKVRRPIQIGSLSYREVGNVRLYEGLGYAEVGIDLHPLDFLLQPFVGVEVGAYNLARFRERDLSPLALEFANKTQVNGHSRLGMHLTSSVLSCMEFSVDVAWDYLFTNRRNELTAQFDFSDNFTTCGTRFDRNEVDAAVTLTGFTCDCIEFYVEGTGQFWSHAQAYTAQAGLKYSF